IACMDTFSRYTVRPMRPKDIAQVAGIERVCFPESWSVTDFEWEFALKRASCYLVACDRWRARSLWAGRRRPSAIMDFVTGLRHLWGAISAPAVTREYIVGYVGLRFVADEAHLTSIAVREEYRRKGIGELLFNSALEVTLERKARMVILEVRSSNLAAQALYSKYGFAEAGVRRRYYSDNGEDGLIMTRDNSTSVSSKSVPSGHGGK
ncbi:ribosomal protein S18-alanine N-acetyltransferase, partial [Chloroflexota bacterium]